MALKIGNHEFREFTAVDAAFGARLADYPKRDALPDDYMSHRAPGCKIASALFLGGGSLADHGRTLKPGVDSVEFHTALRALLCSFDPPHEVKEATAGLLIDTYTTPTGSA